MDEPVLDLFMAAISNIDIWTPLIALLVLYAVIFGGFKGRALVFCVGVALLVNGNLTVDALKKFVDRRRPKQVRTRADGGAGKGAPGVSHPLQASRKFAIPKRAIAIGLVRLFLPAM